MNRTAVLCLVLGVAACKSGGSGGGGDSGTGALGTCPMNEDDLISDFTMDNGIHPADGRSGGWYLYGDDLGHFDPANSDAGLPYPIDMTTGNPYCSGPGSFHVKGAGFALWGAAAATDFMPAADDAGTIKTPYDATKYKGISFWARGSKVVQYVQIKFPDINTDLAVADPKCVLTAGAPNNCSPYIVKFQAPNEFPKYQNSHIDTTWRQFNILFADSKQDMFNTGYQPPNNQVDVAHLLGFAIQVNANFTTTPTTANDFEIWIDDVAFIR